MFLHCTLVCHDDFCELRPTCQSPATKKRQPLHQDEKIMLAKKESVLKVTAEPISDQTLSAFGFPAAPNSLRQECNENM